MRKSVRETIKTLCRLGLVVGIALAVFTGETIAQSPQSTTATYDAWQLRCENRGAEANQELCEVVQVIQIQGQSQPLVQIAVGHPPAGSDLRLVMQLPIGVWIPFAPQFFIDADGTPLAGAFKRCTPAACFADVPLTAAHVASIEVLGDAQGSVIFQMTEGQNATIPISFKGFLPAFRAMEARSAE